MTPSDGRRRPDPSSLGDDLPDGDDFLVWPAVDLLEGRCVRLYRGDYDRVTEYGRDPVAVARRFVADGAPALHLVDLDGAREGEPVNAETILEVRRRVDVPVQVGGGVRTEADVARYLDAGVDRVILGTAAARRPEWTAGLVERHGPGAVAAGVDVREGEVVVEGWTEEAGIAKAAFLDRLEGTGIRVVVYTDTVRDGTLTAPDVRGAREVVERGFRTLVAGGISRRRHILDLRRAGARGVVVGSALYTGALTLGEALAAARGEGTASGGGEEADGDRPGPDVGPPAGDSGGDDRPGTGP